MMTHSALMRSGLRASALLMLAFLPLIGVESLTLDDLYTRPVIGQLGVPLGTLVDAKVEVVAGSELNNKADASSYLLRVIAVNGTPVTPPPLMRFRALPWCEVKIANTHFSWYEKKHGSNPKALTAQDIQNLNDGYVGSQFMLRVWEEGQFTGGPNKMSRKDMEYSWASEGFGFRTSLCVMREAQ